MEHHHVKFASYLAASKQPAYDEKDMMEKVMSYTCYTKPTLPSTEIKTIVASIKAVKHLYHLFPYYLSR